MADLHEDLVIHTKDPRIILVYRGPDKEDVEDSLFDILQEEEGGIRYKISVRDFSKIVGLKISSVDPFDDDEGYDPRMELESEDYLKIITYLARKNNKIISDDNAGRFAQIMSSFPDYRFQRYMPESAALNAEPGSDIIDTGVLFLLRASYQEHDMSCLDFLCEPGKKLNDDHESLRDLDNAVVLFKIAASIYEEEMHAVEEPDYTDPELDAIASSADVKRRNLEEYARDCSEFAEHAKDYLEILKLIKPDNIEELLKNAS